MGALGFVDGDHALGLGVWDRLQQNGVHDAEHRRVRANAERQHSYGGDGENGIAPQRRESVAKVSQQRFDPSKAALVAMLFLHLFDSSEGTASGAASFLRRQAAGEGISFGQLDVSENLVFEFPIEAPPAHQRQQARGGTAEGHDSASKKRATRAAAFSQFATSTRSCFRPALVRE